MKPRIRVLSLLAALLSAAAPAQAENPTQISFGCAPWDGQSLVIKVGAPDAAYELTLWGAGLSALHAGDRKTLQLKPDGSSQDDGVGRLCGTGVAAEGGKACRAEIMNVYFDRFEGQPGGTVSGRIDFRGMKVPFSGTIDESQQFCG